MKKFFLGTILITISMYGKGILYNSAEEARIQNFISIDKKIPEINLNLNSSDYIYDFNRYVKENNITIKTPKILKNEINELNKNFIYSEKPFNYKKFLINMSYELPSKKRMEIVKEIILEEADYLIFKDIVEKKLINECKIVKKERKKEIDELIAKKVRNLNIYVSKIPDCRLDSLTVNGKKQFLKKVERKAFKTLFLERLYLTRGKSISELKKELEFFKSSEYQKTYKLKKEISEKLMLTEIDKLNINKIKKDIQKKIIKKEKKKEPKMNQKFEGDLEFLND